MRTVLAEKTQWLWQWGWPPGQRCCQKPERSYLVSSCHQFFRNTLKIQKRMSFDFSVCLRCFMIKCWATTSKRTSREDDINDTLEHFNYKVHSPVIDFYQRWRPQEKQGHKCQDRDGQRPARNHQHVNHVEVHPALRGWLAPAGLQRVTALKLRLQSKGEEVKRKRKVKDPGCVKIRKRESGQLL